MYCTITFQKDGIPSSIKVEKKENSLVVEIKDQKISIPIENIQRVLDFFK